MEFKVNKHFWVLISITVLWCISNYPIMESLWTYSFDDGTYSHAYLIPFILVYLFYILEQEGRVKFRTKPSKFWSSLSVIIGLGLLIATRSQISLLYWAVSLVMLSSIVFCIFRYNISTLFPFAFLIFIFPFWGALAAPLQSLSVYIVTLIMGLTNIPVYVENEFVTIPAGIFEIAEGCSGLRYVIVSAAISSLYIFLYLKTIRSALIFSAVALIGALVTNWLRIAALIVIGHETEMQSSLMTDHNNFGWYIYIPVAVFQFYVGRKLEDREQNHLVSKRDSRCGVKNNLSLKATAISGIVCILFSSGFSSVLSYQVPNESCEPSKTTITPVLYNVAQVCSSVRGGSEISTYEFDGTDLESKASFYLNSPIPKGFQIISKFEHDLWNVYEIRNAKMERFMLAYRYGTPVGNYKSLMALKKARLKSAFYGNSSSSIQWMLLPCEDSCDFQGLERSLR